MKNHKKVIQFSHPAEPKEWVFYDWVQGSSTPIADWLEELSDEAADKLNSILKLNRKTQNFVNWTGFKRFMQGDLKKEKVWEIEFYADGRAYRLLMVCGKARKQAVILIGCYHKQRVYTPADALQTAFRRAKALRNNEAGTCERQIEEDF